MTKMTVMTIDRRLVDLDWPDMTPAESRGMMALLDFVQASDDVWVPRCDITSYENGSRRPRRDDRGKRVTINTEGQRSEQSGKGLLETSTGIQTSCRGGLPQKTD